jgi:hypothetical protein
MRSKRKKLTTAVGATALAVAIALTGTFAWQSISQMAKNEAMAPANPGGRLHDDFNGSNKDVYVENFMEAGSGGPAIFARVRLDEYMEVGSGAGLKTGDEGFDTKKAQSLEADAKLEDVTTWKTHIPNNPDNKFDDYWDWTTGGSTTYMPTFNKNKDSLAADINGTYEGTIPDDDAHYDDYKAWKPGEQKTANAIYDADTNDTDEGDGALEGTNIEKKEETHTAKATGNATVMTMKEWMEAGSTPGAYWVWDEDGWAYWAQAIQPGEATGLLLDGIELNSAVSDSWYYGINVVGQFVTADDLGQKDGTGFYDTQAGKAPTENAEKLLAKIGVQVSGKADKVTVSVQGDKVYKENKTQFSAKVFLNGVDADNQEVNWTLAGNTSDSTTINSSGLLTVGADEGGQSLTVTATHVDSVSGALTDSKTMTVRPAVERAATITPGSADTVTIDGIEFYVLAKDTAKNQALLITKDIQEKRVFNTEYSNVWAGCAMRTYLNGEWISGKATLKTVAVETMIQTRSAVNSQDFAPSSDKVFLLSEADVFGTQNEQTALPQDYTYNGAKLPAPGGNWIASIEGETFNWWCRSPKVSDPIGVGVVTNVAGLNGDDTYAKTYGVRPALWVNLGGGENPPADPWVQIGAQIKGITPGAADTVIIDGVEFHVLAKDTTKNQALLLTKDIQEEKAFDTDSQVWEGSDMQTYLNGEWLNGKAMLKQYAVSTTIQTRSTWDGTEFTPSSNKVFLLSEADVFGTQNSQPAQPQDYTYYAKSLPAPGGSWVAKHQDIADWYWLRSPRVSTGSAAYVLHNGSLASSSYLNAQGGIRPALWVNLAA